MPPKRKTPRPAQLQAQSAQSDYDTDTANITDLAVGQAPPPQRTNTELNLTVLRRYMPDIEHIIGHAPFSVVYTFSPETQQWEKFGVEGTLFVCQLTGQRYSVVILNRKSLDNFVTELTSADDVEVTEQYVILQALGSDGTPQIFGLWIFSDSDGTTPDTREYIAQLIQSCAMQAQTLREGIDQGLEQGYEEEEGYAADESEQYQQHQQSREEQAVPQQSGQALDLLHLFNRTSSQGAPELSSQATRMPVQPPAQQPARFDVPPDTDFFRTTQSPPTSSHFAMPPSTQQNTLLGLLRGGG